MTGSVPHIQIDQTSDDRTYGRLVDLAFLDDRVEEQLSGASLPGALGLVVKPGLPIRREAMIVGREFAHIHKEPGSGSLHLRLPGDQATEAVSRGWGQWHPFALDGSAPGLTMIFAPRNDADLAVVKRIIDAAIEYATTPVDDR